MLDPRVGVVLAIVLNAAFLVGAAFTVVLVLALLERKVSGWIQDRHGPNRVGPWGILQPVADGVKFLTKEDVVPSGADKPLYVLAPAMAAVPALIVGAVVPFSKPIPADGFIGTLLSATVWAPDGIPFQVARIDIGVLYFFAITSLGVYGIILAGWASNNKYALLGGLRASAQLMSYELTMGLAILSTLVLTGTLRIDRIVEQQAGGAWYIIYLPLPWLLFTIASLAETNRLPFDLPECEQELVAGYHAEYSAMKFAMFYLSEYINIALGACLNVCLFFGGYTLFGLEQRLPWWATLCIFLGKVFLLLFVTIWVRWTLPRFRYDQLMRLEWKILLPIAIGTLAAITLGVSANIIWQVPLWPAVIGAQIVATGGIILVGAVESRTIRARPI